MTPAINAARKAKVNFNIHHYEHDPSSASYGEEAATKLNVSADRVFKTLVIAVDSCLAVSVVPVSKQLDLKSFAKVLKSKKANMADKKDVERATGYVMGGVSPLGQKKQLATVIDKSALTYNTVYVSAGRRGLEIEINPNDLITLTNGKIESISKS